LKNDGFFYLIYKKKGNKFIMNRVIFNGINLVGISQSVSTLILDVDGLSQSVAGLSGSIGATGSTGPSGVDGSNSARWIMSTASVPSADPGSNYFYVDNTSFASLSSISISKDDVNNLDLYAWLSQLFSVYGLGNTVLIQITEVGNPSVAAYLSVSSVVDNTTWFDISFGTVIGSATLTNGNVYTISWIYSGINGVDGLDGSNSSRWRFDVVTTAPADPGSYLFCTNNTSFVSMTDISISTTDFNSNSMYDWLKYIETSKNSGREVTLQIAEIGAPTVMGVVQIGTVSDNGTYFNFVVDSLLAGSAASLNDSQYYTISYNVGGFPGVTGASGENGATGSTGATGATGPERVYIQAVASDETSAITVGTAKVTFRMPCALTLTEVRASLTTAQSSGSVFTVDINQDASSILSTKLTIDNGERTSVTAATAAVISNTSLTDDSEITVDVDQCGATASGLKITLIGTRV
jgi:hypothetical protein